jgi:rRNA-processing protein FCF1
MICKVKSYEQSAKSGGTRGITATSIRDNYNVETQCIASVRRTGDNCPNCDLCDYNVALVFTVDTSLNKQIKS